MRISIFGLGYVGAVSGACLAKLGHDVTGVDLNETKIKLINAGQPPIVEEGIAELTAEVVADGRFRATADADGAVRDTDISLISVGTPSAADGSLSLRAVDAVVEQIGSAIKQKSGAHTVVVRSTVLPGTTEDRIAPALAAASGREIGSGLELCFNPEFLREGSSVKDFFEPPFTIIGSMGEGGYETASGIYAGLDGDVVRTGCRVAESVKYLSNVFHAAKITFANEVGALLKSVGIDGREAMDIFCLDRDLNISRAYLRPGFAFGGSCLPKDLRAMLSLARAQNVDLPFLSHIIRSNEVHIDRAFQAIASRPRGKVAFFGLSFKPGTDDLRESPLVALAERLLGKGYDLAILDEHVDMARLTGANREFIDREIPHLEKLLTRDTAAALVDARFVVVGHVRPGDVAQISADHAGKLILDLQGIDALRDLPGVDYEGICW